MHDTLLRLTVLATLCWLFWPGTAPAVDAKADAPAGAVLGFAAASLKDALDEVSAVFSAASAVPVRFSYASSGTLARQIERGAPAGLYIAAHPLWMDYLQQRGLLLPDSRVDLLGNRLVLIGAPPGPITPPELGASFDLAGALGDGRLALGDPAHVPAGIYARAALQTLGLWPAAAGRLAFADNARATLTLVARGEAPLGVVYASDALAAPAVGVLAEIPAASHPPVTYPAALVAAHATPAAARLLAYLRSPAAGAVFSRRGFRPLP